MNQQPQSTKINSDDLAIAEKHLGAEHAEVATLYHNLGGLAHARGDYEIGEPLARRAVEIREALLGPDHPHTLADLAAWAGLLDGLKRYDESEPVYRRALACYEAMANEYEIAVTLNNLAAVCQATNRPDEAETHFRRALAIKEKLLGPDHPDIGVTLNNLALLLKRQGSLTEAATMYKLALAVFERTLSLSHPHLITCRTNYQKLQRKLRQSPAGDFFLTGVDSFRRRFPPLEVSRINRFGFGEKRHSRAFHPEQQTTER